MSMEMRNTVFGFVAASIVVLSLVAHVSAHHVPAAKFDPDMPITLQVSVSKVDWLIPHVPVFA